VAAARARWSTGKDAAKGLKSSTKVHVALEQVAIANVQVDWTPQ
jgi:hypothetical protein